ncbi:MAG TPA: hypothetical protein VMZ29_17465 [Candidatus Bathyarchaeia archaeon]|nr:hypothetical protein [Candidatus Bathyarchaeia archaeon]
MNLSNNSVNNNYNIINLYSLKCDRCKKNIEIPIKKSDKERDVGGIFRIVAIHQCLNEPIAFILFFDDFLALRQKVTTSVTLASINDYDYLDDQQKENIKQISGFNYLYKKLGNNLAKVIYAIITGQRLIIIGEKNAVESSIASIEIFAKYRNYKINLWTDDTIAYDIDIVGTSKEFKDVYQDSVIVDLFENTVQNGSSCSFCENLVQKIIEEPNIDSYINFVSEVLFKLDRLVNDFILVRNLDEVESFLSTLALDETTEEYVEILISLCAHLNPLVAQYYRSNLSISDKSSKEEIVPFRIWHLDSEQPDKISFIQIRFDNLFYYKEELIINNVKKLLEKENYINLYEYFTPSNHYILAPQPKTNFIFCFPRFNFDNIIITKALEFQFSKLLGEEKDLLTNERITKMVNEEWEIEEPNEYLPNKYQIILKVRELLPLLFEQSILESFYFETDVVEIEIRKFINNIIEQLSAELITPKIIHNKNLYTITSTIKNQKQDNPKNDNLIDVNFNIHIYIHQKEVQKTIDLILDLYIKPEFVTIGIELFDLFNKLYNKLQRIIFSSANICKKN